MLLHPTDFEYLRRKYPRYSAKDIFSHFQHALDSIALVVSPEYFDAGRLPASLYAAAVLKVRAGLEKNAWRRADYLGGYYGLLDQYITR